MSDALLDTIAQELNIIDPDTGSTVNMPPALTDKHRTTPPPTDAATGEADDTDDGNPHNVGASWAPVDIGATVAGLLAGTITRPMPTVLALTDGRCMLYPAKVNGIAGASGDGKSLLAQWASAEELKAGHTVVYVDLEDDAPSVVSRLLAMGVDPGTIAASFVYVSPDEPYGTDAQAQLQAVVKDRRPTLVVVDSTGESLAVDGARPNDDDDVARWFRRLPTALARMGPAVAVIDHMPHDKDGRLTPIGSQRKRAAIGGAQYITDLARPFSRESAGMVKVICGKDRNGNYRRGQVVAEVTVTPEDDGQRLTVTVEAPDAGDGAAFRPTHLMEKVSRHLEEAGEPLTRNAIRDEVPGNKPAVVKALAVLVNEGYVERTQAGQAHNHRSLKPYREALG